MVEHASDCALHNAPAMAPGPCSCGASPLFKMFSYDIAYDEFRWRKYCRETLVAEIVSAALGRLYAGGKGVRTSILIGRALQCGLRPLEQSAIDQAWENAWRPYDATFLARHGIDDSLAAPDGSPISPELRASLSERPGDDEVRDAMAPWIDYWSAQPDPVRPLRDLAA